MGLKKEGSMIGAGRFFRHIGALEYAPAGAQPGFLDEEEEKEGVVGKGDVGETSKELFGEAFGLW